MALRGPSAAVLAGRSRRTSATAAGTVRWEWRIPNLLNKVNLGMEERVRIATELLLSKITQNINIAVTRSSGRVTGRSKPGEYPHAETSHLKRTTFKDHKNYGNGIIDGYIGTPLDYGLILETRMNRSFLVRSLNENAVKLGLIMTRPIT